MIYLAALSREIPPLMVIDLLNRIHATLVAYFQLITVDTIKTNFTTVFQLLEDMVDYAYPLLTEPNSLMAMVRVPTVANRLSSILSGQSNVSEFLPGNALSTISWRRKGVQYNANEVTCDCVERLNCIVNAYIIMNIIIIIYLYRNGKTVRCSVAGTIYCRCYVNGTPDISIEFNNPSLLLNPTFHPCVRLRTWASSSILSFIPPDGSFILMEYSLPESVEVNVPIYCKPILTYNTMEDNTVQGRIEVMVGTRYAAVINNTPYLPLDNIHVKVPFPDCVSMVTFEVNTGYATFDPATKMIKWAIGKIPELITPQLTGKILLKHGSSIPKDKPTISLLFSAPGRTVSGLQMKSFKIVNMLDAKVTNNFRRGIQNGVFEVRV